MCDSQLAGGFFSRLSGDSFLVGRDSQRSDYGMSYPTNFVIKKHVYQ